MRRAVSFLVTLFVISFFFVGGAAGPSVAEAPLPEAVALGTSSIGSAFYVMAVGIANMISKHTPMSATAESVGGSDANMRAIRVGKVHLGMANSFSSGNAFRGTRQFAGEGKIPIRLIAIGGPSMRQLVARSAAGIKTVPDLKGKKLVAKRRAMAEIELVADAILKAYGISKEDVRYIATPSTTEAINALMSGTVDAGVIPGQVPASYFIKLAERIDVKFIDIPADKMTIVLDELGPAFHSAVLPAGTYKGQDQDAHSPSLSTTLVVAENFPEEAVYQITKTLFDHYDELKLVHRAARYFTVENTLEKFHIPFHSGATKYFKETGAWTSDHEKKQQKFL